MALVHHQQLQLIPPLQLPPRQLKKVRISCEKWLIRFLSVTAAAKGVEAHDGRTFGALAASLLPPHEQATGFVVLNGGILAGCTPYDLRRTLEARGLLNCAATSGPQECSPASRTPPSTTPTPPPSRCVLQYSSTLPFMVSSVPLQIPGDVKEGDEGGEGSRTSPFSISVMRVTVLEPTHAAASATAASSRLSDSSIQDDVPLTGRLMHRTPTSSPAVDDATADRASAEVVVLRVPPTASLWKGGSASTPCSSANKGCGFLFLVPCNVAAVRSRVASLLQRPVVGIELLLLSSSRHRWCAIAQEKRGSPGCPDSSRPHVSLSNEASPLERLCTSRAVPEVPGLFLVEDFVTADEEKNIWQELYHGRQRLKLEFLSRRRVAHFNRRFLYGRNALTAEGEMVNARPSFYMWMRARLQNEPATGGVHIQGEYPFHPGDYECDQLTVNYYDYSELGVCGIAAHVDAHSTFDDAVLIVSLGSYTVMEFERWDAPPEAAAPVGVCLAPRSLAVMTGECRYGWTHCIAEKRTDTLSELLPTLTRGDRMSLTWRRGRTERHIKATCPFPALCDGE
ncbi:hypothetical protein GH5_05038 [Leishmania sp. Ghana 2012 LV757]|uniref:hypothetical protein n=1 Tax=Leishmania sp. Ghana 2012 LV757 TaxID=2803181 RepID=UPI001B679547|nr:hypothetical protein GH5_05038 [Leishmania sp. Ghana 2012 LV757]